MSETENKTHQHVDHKTQQHVDPWTASVDTTTLKNIGFNYDKLIKEFGSTQIDSEFIEKFERITGHKAHLWIKRGIYFSHRDLDKALDFYAAGNQIYLYTGRGPSSESMHIGHMIPFMFTKYLQDVFNAIVIIQISDDEKYLFRDDDKNDIDYYVNLGKKNALDIMACGFNPSKTYIYSNVEMLNNHLCDSNYYKNFIKISKCVNGTMLKGTYGFSLDATTNSGKLMWPSMQITPAFYNTFPNIFPKKAMCIVPMAIDQDPYFRTARDVAHMLHYIKPCAIHSKFVVGLSGISSKMSASSNKNDVIFLSDTSESIKKKINKCFSGGRETREEHARLGANLEVDVAYQYIYYLEPDDVKVNAIATEYSAGRMFTGEVKSIAISLVQQFIKSHQMRKELLTDEIIKQFFNMKKQQHITSVNISLDETKEETNTSTNIIHTNEITTNMDTNTSISINTSVSTDMISSEKKDMIYSDDCVVTTSSIEFSKEE